MVEPSIVTETGTTAVACPICGELIQATFSYEPPLEDAVNDNDRNLAVLERNQALHYHIGLLHL